MSPRLAFALEAAVAAGKGTMKHFQTGVAVQTKEDDSPVTIADQEAEAHLRKLIEKSYPGEPILGEEEGQTGEGDDRWVIDPIDGTKSFICGVPLFATLLSYEVAAEPVIGICYFPALDELLYAVKGGGSLWRGKPCRVSERTSLEGSVLCSAGYLGLKQKGLMPGFECVSEGALATRTWCDAYGHALVASGRVDAMIDPSIKRWDVSAMSLIVREAGGRFTDLDGREELGDTAISSNWWIHDALLKGLKE